MTPDKSASIQDTYNFRQLNDKTSSSGSVSKEQIQSLSAQGYQVVINLLPEEHDHALAEEKQLIESQDLEYIHIPVDFKAPTDADYQEFAEAMDMLNDQRLHIHCAANWRVSAFYAIYQVQTNNWFVDQAWEFISSIWSPSEHPPWEQFITRMISTS